MNKQELQKMLKQEIKKEAMYEKARRDFFYYCCLMIPKMYKDKPHLKEWCNLLQKYYENKNNNDVFNLSAPPRHGKSLTAQLLCTWILGKNNKLRLVVVCYNKLLSQKFGKAVRNIITATKTSKNTIIYNDIFKDTKIKHGYGAVDCWMLTNSNEANFLVVSPDTSLTGFGADILLIDDLIKNAYESKNEKILDDKFNFITDTALSRLENQSKIIITMTRWAERDIAGRILEKFDNVENHVYKCLKDDGSMLCDDILDRNKYEILKKNIGADIFLANYQQELLDVKGRLYNLKFYENKNLFNSLKPDERQQALDKIVIKNYTDVADKGTDYLCSINYFVIDREIFIHSVYYSQLDTSKTETALATFLINNKVKETVFEANNGGEIFKRNVERKYRELSKTNNCIFKSKTQTKNKEARILSQATWLNEHCYLNSNLPYKYQEFYTDLFKFQAEFRANKHDDCADCLTMIADSINTTNNYYV